MKKLFILITCAIFTLNLVACGAADGGGETSGEKTKIRIGCTEVSKVVFDAAEENYVSKGYEVEYTLFDNNVNILKAANDGSVDIAMAVHKPFMEKFNSENNGDLHMVEPYAFFTGIGLYSEKYSSVEELPDNAKISIMNDAMNMDKGLRMLRDAGLIELDESIEGTYTVLDIKSNPRGFEIIEMDQSQTVRTLEDLDAAIVFFTHMRNAGKDFLQYLIRDLDGEDYPIGVVVKSADKEAKWALDLAESIRTEEVRKAVLDYYGGVFEYYEY